MADEQLLNDIANRLRVLSIESTNASNSGHPTTCASIAEVMSVLFFDEMRQILSDLRCPSSDRLVLSKGHAAPILYAAWAVAGLFPEERLLDLRKIDCELEGHPTPKLEFVDVATGSLGQGLSCAAGMAYTAKHFDNLDYRVYCIMGDGEVAEGSVWEAMNFAQHYKLDNLVAIFDVNRLGQSGATCLQHNMDVYKARCEAFGFHSIVVDGHCVKAIKAAFAEARATKGKPTALILKTYKGRGIPGIEDQENWHGKPLGDKAAAAIQGTYHERIFSSETTLMQITRNPDRECVFLSRKMEILDWRRYRFSVYFSNRSPNVKQTTLEGCHEGALDSSPRCCSEPNFSVETPGIQPRRKGCYSFGIRNRCCQTR